MTIATVLKYLPAVPSRKVARQIIEPYASELLELWTKQFQKEHGHTFIAGIRFGLLAFPPGAHPPAAFGAIRDVSPFELPAGRVKWTFAMTDDLAAPVNPDYLLWFIDPDPEFVPDGVSDADEEIKDVEFRFRRPNDTD